MREALRACIKDVLTHPHNFDWTVQGFGMMRAYIPGPVYDKQFRLNIWDSTLAVPNVSVIHDHPWAFKSWIINGRFTNVRYIFNERLGDAYNYMTIKTGIGGGPDGPPKVMWLMARPPEIYVTGDTYHQTPSYNEQWVDAMPRKAMPWEREIVIQEALEHWQ